MLATTRPQHECFIAASMAGLVQAMTSAGNADDVRRRIDEYVAAQSEKLDAITEDRRSAEELARYREPGPGLHIYFGSELSQSYVDNLDAVALGVSAKSLADHLGMAIKRALDAILDAVEAIEQFPIGWPPGLYVQAAGGKLASFCPLS